MNMPSLRWVTPAEVLTQFTQLRPFTSYTGWWLQAIPKICLDQPSKISGTIKYVRETTNQYTKQWLLAPFIRHRPSIYVGITVVIDGSGSCIRMVIGCYGFIGHQFFVTTCAAGATGRKTWQMTQQDIGELFRFSTMASPVP